MIDRIPPHNLEAEMALLGASLVDAMILDDVSGLVSPSDMYAHVHETIFSVILELRNAGSPIDKITVSEALRKRDALERVGGLSYLSALMDTVQSAASAEYYAKIVREKAVLRGLIHASTTIAKVGYNGEEDVPGALDAAEQALYAVSAATRPEFTPLADLAKPTFERLSAQRGITGLLLGFPEIDALIGGLEGGQLAIIAARTGMGKTAFALNIAVNIAATATAPTPFFSLEMSSEELMQRLLSSQASIPLQRIRQGAIRREEWDDVGRALDELSALRILIDESGSLTVNDIRSRSRRIAARNGLAAIFVDYLQLLHVGGSGRQENRNEELTTICRNLKAVAKDLHVPIIALAQLNRNLEMRGDKRPQLSDLRDSGAIEQDADLVAFLYRDAYYNREADPSVAEFIIAKNRMGPSGVTVPLRFVGELTQFSPTNVA